MTDRKGDWMQTFTGRQFWPIDPRQDEIDIVDIAAALSKLTRYGGHCLRFYSVAEHCVLMARSVAVHGDVTRGMARAMLLHDASEAYLIDVPRPVKSSLTGYHEIEDRLMRAISARLVFDWPPPALIKEFDERIIVDEREQVMAVTDHPWQHSRKTFNPLGVTLQFWTPDQAFAEFMREYARCGGSLQ